MSYLSFRETCNINSNNLDNRYINHFSSDSMLDKLSRELCASASISKKEFAESIEFIKIAQRFIKKNKRISIYDICGGHGLVGILLYLLSPEYLTINIVDLKKPKAFGRLLNIFSNINSNIESNITYIEKDFTTINYRKGSLLLGVHACGFRTDEILNITYNINGSTIVLPCCYKPKSLSEEYKRLTSIYSLQTLIDLYRINTAYNNNYKVNIKKISEKITPMNKVFYFSPQEDISND